MAYDPNLGREQAKKDNVLLRFGDMSPDYQPRNFYGALLEPEKTVIHGAGQDHGSYGEYSKLLSNNKPLMEMTYVTIADGLEPIKAWRNGVAAALEKRNDQPTALQIGLNITYGNDDGRGGTDDAARGNLDAEINAVLDALESFNVPTYLRIGYEFEGEWNGYNPESYVETFRRITAMIRDRNMDQIATIWCSAGGSAGFIPLSDLMQYYPGSEWVDWWSVDIFSPEEIPHPWLGKFYELAHTHNKPVMIGEATPRYVGAEKGWHSWIRWYRPFFEMVRNYPQIKAISYINWDWAFWSDEYGFEWHDWEDSRIQKSDLVEKLYRNELSHPIWLHASGIDDLAPPK